MKRLLLILVFIAAQNASAVIIYGGDGSQNTGVGRMANNGWQNVGTVDSLSSPCAVTYVADNWFITANHVWENEMIGKGIENVVLNQASYGIDMQSSVRLTSAGGAASDLRMFRASSDVLGVTDVSVATSAFSIGTSVSMIGHGMNRDSGLTDFGVGEGYYWGANGSEMRWGMNNIEGYGVTKADTACFYTDFDGVYGEAQATIFDSGGGVFVNEESGLTLAGIMIAASYYPVGGGQNVSLVEGTTSSGFQASETYVADLSAYSDQIDLVLSESGGTSVPEPTTAILFLGAAAAVIGIRRVFSI